MAKRKTNTKPAQIGAQCDLSHGSFAVALSDITSDGCSCEAPTDWEGELDFLHLKIAGRIEINGRVLSLEGRRARIRFYGQIHPAVVDELGRVAA